VKETARNPSAPDLIDRIGDALPAEVRADFYRELRHCRSLPESDEMLRILRAMMYGRWTRWKSSGRRRKGAVQMV
jgi:hypothetical protein